MIARVWRGVVARSRLAEYVAYVDATGVSEYRNTAACLFSAILTRDIDIAGDAETGGGVERSELIAFSVWADEDAIRAFAGDDITAMVLYPEDDDYLLETPTLVHHDVTSAAFPGGEGPAAAGLKSGGSV